MSAVPDWRVVHYFADDACTPGVPLTRGFSLGCKKKTRSCPHNHGTTVSAELAPAITALLRRRGIDYDPGDPINKALWCLGGVDLYRSTGDMEADQLTSDACLDLNLSVCDEHRTISLDLYPYNLAPESGGSDPDDPLRSEPIELTGMTDPEVIANVVARVETWLDTILLLPKA